MESAAEKDVSQVKTDEHKTWCDQCKHYYKGDACPVCGRALLFG